MMKHIAKGRGRLYLLLWLLIAALALQLGLILTIYRTTQKEYSPSPADVIIVLGGRVKPDGSMSLTLKRRTEKAFSAWQQNLSSRFIVCGGQGADEPFTEAHSMHQYLLQLGVPEEDIFLEDTSTNTYENLTNARQIMKENGMKNALVVTSDYHVTRALWLCRDVGIEAQGYSSLGPDRWQDKLKALIKESISWEKYWVFRLLGLNQ